MYYCFEYGYNFSFKVKLPNSASICSLAIFKDLGWVKWISDLVAPLCSIFFQFHDESLKSILYVSSSQSNNFSLVHFCFFFKLLVFFQPQVETFLLSKDFLCILKHNLSEWIDRGDLHHDLALEKSKFLKYSFIFKYFLTKLIT